MVATNLTRTLLVKKLKFQNLVNFFWTFPSHKVVVKWPFLVNMPLSQFSTKTIMKWKIYYAFREATQTSKSWSTDTWKLGSFGGWVVRMSELQKVLIWLIRVQVVELGWNSLHLTLGSWRIGMQLNEVIFWRLQLEAVWLTLEGIDRVPCFNYFFVPTSMVMGFVQTWKAK